MGNETQLKFWVLQNIQKLEIEIERFSWIERVRPGLTDVSVSLKHGSAKLVGWGFGESEDLALTKALAEIFERVVLVENRFATSNGLAAHIKYNLAAQNAVNELRERDLFLSHFLTQTPFSRSERDLILEFGLLSIHKWFEERGVRFQLWPLGKNGIVASIDGRNAEYPFGFVFGSSVKEDLRAAAMSASIEVCRDGARLLSKGKDISLEALSLPEFLEIARPGFEHHGRLALDLDYANSIRWLVEGSSSVLRDNDHHGIHPSEIFLKSPELADIPLKFARASSSALQDIYLGATAVEKMNLNRLSEFAGRKLTWDDLNKLPHPFA